jgi:hypothetical protein
MIEYLIEARKFIERARAARTVEVRDQDLEMAEWCIARAIDEAGPARPSGDAREPAGRAGVKPS